MAKRVWAILITITLILSLFRGVNVSATAIINEDTGKAQEQALSQYVVLSVATGVNPGTDVVYFGIVYEDRDGITRTDFIFPNMGGLTDSLNLAKSLAGNDNPATVKSAVMKNNYGITISDFSSLKPLQANSVDDYLFKPTYDMIKFVGFDVYMEKNDSKSKWTCNGISLYTADKVAGVEMMGYYSNSYFINFEGVLLGTANVGSVDAQEKSVVANCRANKTDERQLTMHSREDNIVHEMAKPYGIKIDLASVAGGGMDGFIQGAESNNPISSTNGIGSYQEALMMSIDYIDMGGIYRSYSVPVMMSELCYLNMQGLGSKSIYGLGQADDSLAFPMIMPGLGVETRPKFKLYYSSDLAIEKCGLKYDSSRTMKTVPEDDKIGIAAMQIYKTMPQLAVDDAAMRLNVTTVGNPIWYYTSNSIEGTTIKFETGNRGIRGLDLGNILDEYDSGANLSPKSSGNMYLIEMTIDEDDLSAIDGELIVDIGYVNNRGKKITYKGINVADAVEEFYGYWVSTGKDGAYQICSVPNGVLRFMVSIDNVRKFTDMRLSIPEDNPEKLIPAQFKEIKIYGVMVDGEGKTAYSFANTSRTTKHGDKTRWELKRTPKVNTTPYVNYTDRCYVDNKTPVNIEFGVTANQVQENTDVDWTKYREGMTYNDTKQNMGYANIRTTYVVDVKVANDEAGITNDSGSTNQFYFQLLFENGKKTAYVLANQQLASDSFRSGQIETFKIYSNYEYGDIAAVRIIPDDQQDGSNEYDKLNIDTISISKESLTGISRTWRVSNVGWIGIDYNDSGATGSIIGRDGRNEGEMARTYQITDLGYSVNVLVEVDVKDYSYESVVSSVKESQTVITGDGRMVSTNSSKMISGSQNSPQVTGKLNYTLKYKDENGQVQRKNGDAYSGMYNYLGINPGTENSNGVPINQDYMMKANSVNRFIVTLDGPKSMQSLELKFTGDGKTTSHLNIKSVRIYRIVNGTGNKYISNNSIVRDYDTTLLVERDYEDPASVLISTYNTDNPEPISLLVEFAASDYNNISVDESLGTWNSVVGAEPTSKDDTLNVHVHMVTQDECAGNTVVANPEMYDLEAIINYDYCGSVGGTRRGQQNVRSSQRIDSDFYFKGVEVYGMTSFSTFAIRPVDKNGKAITDKNYNMLPGYAIVERVRAGVIIDTWYLTFGDVDISASKGSGKANSAGTVGVFVSDTTGRAFAPTSTQRIMLCFGEDTKADELKRDEAEAVYTDVGVSIMFTSKLDPKTEGKTTYYSPYTFLSTKQIKSLKPHQLVTVNFDQKNVDQILGIRVFKQGKFTATLESATVMALDRTEEQNVQYIASAEIVPGMNADFDIPTAPYELLTDEEFKRSYVTLQLTTASVAGGDESDPGCTDPISLTMKWANENQSEKRREITDLKSYVQSGDFKAGKTATITFAVADFKQMHTLELKPINADTGAATWKLEKINLDVYPDVNNDTYSREVLPQKWIMQSGGGEKINFANISVLAEMFYKTVANGEIHDCSVKIPTEQQQNNVTVSVAYDTIVTIQPFNDADIDTVSTGDRLKFVKGSFMDVAAEIAINDGAETYISSPSAEANFEVHTSIGGEGENIFTYVDRITFKTTNNTTSPVKYRITIYSEEASGKKAEFYIIVDGMPENHGDIEEGPGEDIDWGDESETTHDNSTETDDGDREVANDSDNVDEGEIGGSESNGNDNEGETGEPENDTEDGGSEDADAKTGENA